MPVSEYFKGSGKKVMSSMKKRYGSKAGERVFYATANKKNAKPGQKMTKSKKKAKGTGKGGKQMSTSISGSTRLDTY